MPMDFVPSWILLGSMLVAVASAAFSARSWPIGVRRRVQDLQDRVEAAEASSQALLAKWLAFSAENAAFLEEAEGVLSAVETKRRRIAATKSKMDQTQPEPADRHGELLRLARERGHSV